MIDETGRAHRPVMPDDARIVSLVPSITELLCDAFEREYALLQATPKEAPQVMLYCIWKDPCQTISSDTYIARMREEIGWRCALSQKAAGGEAGVRYPVFSWPDELARSIDGVLLSTEPYRFTKAHVDARWKRRSANRYACSMGK